MSDFIITQLITSGLTTCFTVLGGVLVFVLGQSVVKFFIEPIHTQSKLIGEISYSIVFYEDLAAGTIELEDLNSHELRKRLEDEAVRKMRHQASELIATLQVIPLYHILSKWGLIPQERNVYEAATALIELSYLVKKGNYDAYLMVKKKE
jgi:hypothetical protein